MSSRSASIVVIVACQFFLLTNRSFAHPASGIAVDAQGHVYFLYHGLVRIEASGKLTTIHEDTGGHWLAFDVGGAFSKVTPKMFKRVTVDNAGPTLIFW